MPRGTQGNIRMTMVSDKLSSNKTSVNIDAARLREAENYLSGYSLNRKLLRMDRYEREYYGSDESAELDRESPGEVPLARARMYEIRHFIMSLENCDEKLFLYYRYVKGETVERCAELLGISRASGFRMRKRALQLACERLWGKGKNE